MVEAQEETTPTSQAWCAPEGCVPSAHWWLCHPVEGCRGRRWSQSTPFLDSCGTS